MRPLRASRASTTVGGCRWTRLRSGRWWATVFVAAAILVFMAAAGSASAATSSVSQAKTSAALEGPAGVTTLRAESGATGTTLPLPAPPVARGSGVIFYDGSEGATSPWTVQGNPTWAITTYRAAAGTRSSYCAGSAINSPGPYAASMSAWRIAGPFNLSAVSSATLRYKVYFNTEVNADWISSMVSLDGEYFYGWGDSGNSQGWVDRSRDLTAVPTLNNVCGRSQVWIAFRFASDSSVQYEGAYVDEVEVIAAGGSGGEIELTLDASPSTVPYRGTVGLSGVLSDAGTGSLLPGRDVEWLYAQDDNIVRDWKDGGSVFSSTGQYLLKISPLERRTYFILYYAGDSEYAEGFSNFVKVMSRAKLTPPAVPSRVRAGRLITAWGTLKPQHTAQQNKSSHTRIYVQRFSGGKWRVRAVHQDSDHAKTTSSWRTFTVR